MASTFAGRRTPPMSTPTYEDELDLPKSKQNILTEEATIATIGSAICFVAYNALFIAGQLWPAFGTLALGLYYIPLFYALFAKKRQILGYSLIAQGLNVVVTLALAIFFFVEIFVPKIVADWLKSTYGADIEKKGKHPDLVNVARYTSIAMCLASFLFFLVHSYAFAFLAMKFRKGYKVGISSSTPSEHTPMPTLSARDEPPLQPMSATSPISIPRVAISEAGVTSSYSRGNFPSTSAVSQWRL